MTTPVKGGKLEKRNVKDVRFYSDQSRFMTDRGYDDDNFVNAWYWEEVGAYMRMNNLKRKYDLQQFNIHHLYGALISHWQFLEQYLNTHQNNIRVYNPDLDKNGFESEYTIIEIVNKDMPFLVDSISNALVHLNLNHPNWKR